MENTMDPACPNLAARLLGVIKRSKNAPCAPSLRHAQRRPPGYLSDLVLFVQMLVK
jgi:hypothetical protein